MNANNITVDANAAPLSAEQVHASVQQYYGQRVTEQKSGCGAGGCGGGSYDASVSMCVATGASMHPMIKAAQCNVPKEVMERFYGCGNPVPLGIDGLTVLDLGSGTGRDCFICSQLVGERGRVIGVDMTDESLEVARRAVGPFTAAMGYAKPNVEFVKGFIEQLPAAGVAPNSVDVCISNCVVNLAPDKRAVLQSVSEVLRAGGEMHFADLYPDRRVPEAMRRHPLLASACASGTLYPTDFEQLAHEAGFAEPRMLSIRQVPIPANLKELAGDTRAFSITYRLFKVADLEPTRENYHQTATYKGTIAGHPDSYQLDLDYTFPTNKAVAVCGNTAAILSQSWLARHFTVTGDRSVHYGPFRAAPTVLERMQTAARPESAAAAASVCGTATATGTSAPHCDCWLASAANAMGWRSSSSVPAPAAAAASP